MHAQAAPPSNRVRAVFQDATMLAFDLDHETTLEQLAEHIGKLAEFHGGLYLPVHVRLACGYRSTWQHHTQVSAGSQV